MKTVASVLILIGLSVFPMEGRNKCLGQSSNLPDTLFLKTKQIKGPGFIFNLGAAIHRLNLYPLDSFYSIYYEVKLPANISEIRLASEIVDYNIYGFNNRRKAGQGANEYYKQLIVGKKIDSSNILSLKDNSVCFLKGMRGKEEILIIDENNNKDFRDDTIRPVQKLDLLSKVNLIHCAYNIFNGKNYVKASNWINIGTRTRDRLYFLTSQHYTASFKIENSNYDIELFIDGTRFDFDKPKIVLIGGNGIRRINLVQSEVIGINEYLKLKEGIYKFADLTNDGGYITLVREDHYTDKSGTQIGVIAPAFKFHTTDGDSISSESYKGSNVLLVNISACYSVPSSQMVYKDLAENYGSKLDMVVIDKGGGYLKEVEKWNLPGKLVNADTPDNVLFAKNYRPDYCSRTCFLIGSDGRILDKFEIFDWEKTLSKHLNPKN